MSRRLNRPSSISFTMAALDTKAAPRPYCTALLIASTELNSYVHGRNPFRAMRTLIECAWQTTLQVKAIAVTRCHSMHVRPPCRSLPMLRRCLQYCMSRKFVFESHHVDLEVPPQDAMLPQQLLLDQLHRAPLLATQERDEKLTQ